MATLAITGTAINLDGTFPDDLVMTFDLLTPFFANDAMVSQLSTTTDIDDDDGTWAVTLQVPDDTTSVLYRITSPDGSTPIVAALSSTSATDWETIYNTAVTNPSYVANALESYLLLSGGTMTGALTLFGAPTADLHAATKKYGDDTFSALGHAHATTDITSGTMADARVAESNVTQHEAALTVTESQISDLDRLPTDATINTTAIAYELVAGDAGEIIEANGTFTITLPDGLDTGFQAVIINVGAGTITLAADTTLTSKNSNTDLANQYGAATVYHAGSNVWRAIGDLS